LGLTYSLAAEAAGITYKTFNIYMNRGQIEKSGKYFEFYTFIQQRNADAAKALLERLNLAAKAGDTRIYLWILERRFSADFGRRLYKKIDSVSDNKNEIIVKGTDEIRKEILEKFV